VEIYTIQRWSPIQPQMGNLANPNLIPIAPLGLDGLAPKLCHLRWHSKMSSGINLALVWALVPNFYFIVVFTCLWSRVHTLQACNSWIHGLETRGPTIGRFPLENWMSKCRRGLSVLVEGRPRSWSLPFHLEGQPYTNMSPSWSRWITISFNLMYPKDLKPL